MHPQGKPAESADATPADVGTLFVVQGHGASDDLRLSAYRNPQGIVQLWISGRPAASEFFYLSREAAALVARQLRPESVAL